MPKAQQKKQAKRVPRSNPLREPGGSLALSMGSSPVLETSRLFETVPRSLYGAEVKYVDSGFSYAMTSAGYTLLNGLVPGTGLSGRIGREVTIRAIDHNMRMLPTAANPIISVDAAALIVSDKQADGAIFSSNDLLMSGSPQALQNPLNIQRFHLHRRWDTTIVNYNTAATFATAPQAAVVLIGRIPMNLKVNFNSGGAGTVGDIQTNSLYLYTTATATSALMQGNIRVWYTDQ
jgi:hypothetical protein